MGTCNSIMNVVILQNLPGCLRNHPIFLKFGVSRSPAFPLVGSFRCGPQWKQRLFGSIATYLAPLGFGPIYFFGWTPGNESIFPENQPGTFWDEEILFTFDVIRDPFLVKLIFGEKTGRETWRNHYESLIISGWDHGFCVILLWNQSCCKSSTRIHLQPGF